MMNSTINQAVKRIVQVRADNVKLEGTLSIPTAARGIVLFAHGSGSSRFSQSNRYVADVLHENCFATLLFEMLTPQEEELELHERPLSSDIHLLAKRIIGATGWIAQQPQLSMLPIGYFGVSTGAVAALLAAQSTNRVGAVVTYGGLPDLTGNLLTALLVPTLFVVGANDTTTIEAQRTLLAQMQCEKSLALVPGAAALFQEPRALETLAQLALGWFQTHLKTELLETAFLEVWHKLSSTHEQYRTLQ